MQWTQPGACTEWVLGNFSLSLVVTGDTLLHLAGFPFQILMQGANVQEVTASSTPAWAEHGCWIQFPALPPDLIPQAS